MSGITIFLILSNNRFSLVTNGREPDDVHTVRAQTTRLVMA